ncbi:MAG: glycosyltransferase [Tannerellaceae bacterium]|nr:glycosyltransferase [Tannerellaceae bacterium]
MGAIRIDDPNKGFLYLKESIDKLVHMNEYKEELILILFGKIKNQQLISENLSIPYIHLGSLTNPEQIAKLYITADVTVIPSEYETFGQTILESLACGCPAVSFNNSGQTDILDHKKNGYLAKYKDTEDLAKGIKWGLENGSDPTVIEACIDKVNTHFSEKVITEKYLSLYKKLLNK